ncbi:MAG: glycosyltransferase family 39 protein [Anaerolineaceae bacterium]|nr:MAG: glycosyltransferase family 39 protein [Anaerolineaceae bacterium]
MLLIILLLYCALAIGFGVVNPLFEAPDEHLHFLTARYIADTGKLPNVSDQRRLAGQEAGQPPLYYVLGALIISPFNSAPAEEKLWPNPTVRLGEPQPFNVNAFVHGESERWPWNGYALAAHLLRLISAVAGLGTLLCIYGSGRLLWADQAEIALLATALVAFLPQFVFLHGAVTNDVLIIFLSSFVLWQLLRLWQDSVTTLRLLLLGITIGLAILTKMAGLLLLVMACAVYLLLAWRDSRHMEAEGLAWSGWRHRLWQMALFLVLPVLLLSGWLLVRNWILYGDMTAVNQFVEIHGGNRHFTLRQVWGDLDRVALSAIAYFGWMNLRPPAWIYGIWAGIALGATSGLLLLIWRTRGRSDKTTLGRLAVSDRTVLAAWLAFWVLLVFVSWLQFMIRTPADQGRLLFPTLLPVSLLVAFGLSQWRQRWLLWSAALLALLSSAYSLLVVLPMAYGPPPTIRESDIPTDASRIDVSMGQGLEVVAVETESDVVHAGDWIWITLYWRADAGVEDALFETLAIYDRNHERVGQQRNYHGGGTYPATLWEPGAIVVDRLGAKLAEDVALPTQLRLLLKVGEDRDPVEIARVKAVPDAWPKRSDTVAARLGEGLELVNAEFTPQIAEAGTAVNVNMRWQVSEAPGRELTTFVHLGDPNQVPLAQADGPPFGGGYPTSNWAPGEVLDDGYSLIIPEDLDPGQYPIQVGIYEPDSGARLPLWIGEERQAQDAYPVGWLTVE